MPFFVDEYERQLDDNSRIILPSKLRKEVGEVIYITRAPSDKCLHIYTEEGWSELAEKLKKLPTSTDKNAAAFVRMFFGKASAVKVDKQGRITIAQGLIEYAGITRDTMLVGVNTRLELWDKEKWNAYQNDLADDVVVDGILKYDLGI